jgi:hypothetical protein
VIHLVRRVFGVPILFEVGPDRLVGQEIVFEVINGDAFAFESSTNTCSLGDADLVAGQQSIRVLDFAVQMLDVHVIESGFENVAIKVVSQLTEASAILVGGPELFELRS